MLTVHDFITDEEIKIAFANADFGNIDNREVVNYSLLQYACGITTGSFARAILKDLELISNSRTLTKKGKIYLCIAFNNDKYF